MSKLDELVREAQSLPADARLYLLNILAESLNPTDPSRDQLWAAEAKRRLEEYRASRPEPDGLQATARSSPKPVFNRWASIWAWITSLMLVFNLMLLWGTQQRRNAWEQLQPYFHAIEQMTGDVGAMTAQLEAVAEEMTKRFAHLDKRNESLDMREEDLNRREANLAELER